MVERRGKASHSTAWKITFLSLLFVVVVLLSSVLAAFLHVKNILKVSAEPGAKMRRKYRVEQTEAAGRNVFSFTDKEGSEELAILYLHGGSYKYSFFNAHWNFIGYLVDELSCRVVAPDYPVVPAADYRDVFSMTAPIFEDLAARYPGRFVVMGDSAGGGLALALAEDVSARRPDLAPPVSTVLLSPWLDATMEHPDVIALQDSDFFLDLASLKAAGRLYAGDQSPAYWKVSPLFGDLSALQNIAVFTGTRDMLNPDAVRLKERGGAKVELYEYPGMFHVWFLADGMPLPQIARARKDIVREVRKAAERAGSAAFSQHFFNLV